MVAWLKLLRLPNVFTAVADVLMGYLVTHGNLKPAEYVALLVATSCLLYLSGMVLNDVFDAEVDARERPERPIPSGKVSRRAASAVGWALLTSGVLIGWLVSFLASDVRSGEVATLLAGCILLYDGVLKRTPAAPGLMGACRALNVLLGMSLGEAAGNGLIVIGIGIYIAGVTTFARTEARETPRARLIGGLVVLLAGMGLLAAVPVLTGDRPGLVVERNGWYFLWTVLTLIVARPCMLAIMQPAPQKVQLAVRHCVHSIIVLDAAVCSGYAGPYWGLGTLTLLIPTLALTLWLDAT